MEKHNSLSPAEWRVMEALWVDAPRTITQLTAALERDTGWGKHTIISFLKRMEGKGAVSYVEDGRAKAYSPAYPKEEATLEETERFLGRVFGGRVGLMVSSMVAGRVLSDGEIDELLVILHRAREEEPHDSDS